MNAKTQKVLGGASRTRCLPMASITKIMTVTATCDASSVQMFAQAKLVLDYVAESTDPDTGVSPLSEVITVSERAAR